MSDCFDRLPLWAQSKLLVPHGHQDWKQCRTCQIYKDKATLKTCAACGKARIRPVYYCSMECQRKDWKVHKLDCKLFQLGGVLGKNQDKFAHQRRIIAEWEYVNTRVVTWSMKLAYHYNPSIDNSKVVFDVIIDVETFQIRSFSFTLKDERMYGRDVFKELQGSPHYWYRVIGTFEGVEPPIQSLHRVEPLRWANDLPKDVNFPEWPWIAGHLTRTRGHRQGMQGRKWDLLLVAVETQRKKESGYFGHFIAPQMQIGLPLKVERMREWYKTMSDFDPWGPLLTAGRMEKILVGE